MVILFVDRAFLHLRILTRRKYIGQISRVSFSSCFFCKTVLIRPIAKTSRPEHLRIESHMLLCLVLLHFVIIRYIRM